MNSVFTFENLYPSQNSRLVTSEFFCVQQFVVIVLSSPVRTAGGGVRRCCRVPRCPRCRPTILRRSWPLRGYLSDEAGPVWRNTTRRGFRFYLQSVMTSWFHRLKGSHLRFSLFELKVWKLCRVVAWMGMKPCLLSFSGAESACRDKV